MRLLGLLLQIPFCFSPTIYPVLSGATGAALAPGGTIYFLCNGLQQTPLLQGTNCPGNMIVTAAPVSAVIYMGLIPPNPQFPNGILHVSAPSLVQLTCTNCIQDIFPEPQPGELTIGNYIVGDKMYPTWTGTPAIPSISVSNSVCPNGYNVASSLGSIVVSCN